MIIGMLFCNEKVQKGGTMISKKLFMILGLSCLLLVGCQTAHKTMPESSTLTPTGYASEEVQLISAFYDGSLYLYNATGFDLPKEDGWELLGQVVSVNNLEWPAEDFIGTHLNVGQEIYWEPSEPQKLYVKYDNGFALFASDRDMAGKSALEIIRNLGTDTTNIKIDYGTSSIYTKAEMDAAIELIKKEFSTWDGCELHSISYSTDDECSEFNIAWMNEMEKATDAEETFTQCIMFKSNFHSPLNGGSGFNPDEEYTDWQWWLARSEGGQWKLMTYGY